VDTVTVHQVVGNGYSRLAAALLYTDEIAGTHGMAYTVYGVFSFARDDVRKVDETVDTLLYDPRRRAHPMVVVMYIDHNTVEFLLGHPDHPQPDYITTQAQNTNCPSRNSGYMRSLLIAVSLSHNR